MGQAFGRPAASCGNRSAVLLVLDPVLEVALLGFGEANALVKGKHMDGIVVGRAELGAELAPNAGIDVDLADLAQRPRRGIGNEVDTVLDRTDVDAHLAPAAEALALVDVGQKLRLLLARPGDEHVLHLWVSRALPPAPYGLRRTRPSNAKAGRTPLLVAALISKNSK